MAIIKCLKISWLTDEKIKKISFGEIKNTKTLNNTTFEPEIGGLFCPRVFGPWRSYQCACKEPPRLAKNQICENCGVLIAHSNVRRWRMGHIKLTKPITNTLFLKNILPQMEQLLGISGKNLKELVYCNCYVVLNQGQSKVFQNKQILAQKVDERLISQVLTEIIQFATSQNKTALIKKAQELQSNLAGEEKEQLKSEIEELKKQIKKNPENGGKTEVLREKKAQLEKELKEAKLKVVFLEDYLDFFRKNWKVKIETGSTALEELLKSINLKEELKKTLDIDAPANLEQTNQKIRLLRSLLQNKLPLEGLILNYLPVIPAGLRPATKLNDSNIATTEINNLYRRVIITNERLKTILEINENLQTRVLFSDIINNEKRRLQVVVDQLFYGGEGATKKDTKKSLLQILSGKEGILRKYSLGKRVDYSARSVITPNPKLSLDQVGLPIEMALVLYKPFLFNSLMKEGKSWEEAKQLLLKNDPVIFPLLNKIIENRPVLLNRAPTLHRLGFQGFQPILVLGKTIQIHPLVTIAFNADFDGDQMAVHLPITKKARQEVQEKMMASQNILDPKNGFLIDVPSQDIILGIYYLTRKDLNPASREIPIYYELSQIAKDYEANKLKISSPFIIPWPLCGKPSLGPENEQKFLLTTFGRLQFNQILPPDFPYYLNDLEYYNKHHISPNPDDIITNLPLSEQEKPADSGWKKKDIIAFLNHLAKRTSQAETVTFLDKLKNLGFATATQSGISISLFDLPELTEKKTIFQQQQEKLKKIEEFYQQGFYSEQELSQQKINLWTECKEELEKNIIQKLGQNQKTSLYHLWDSGARANSENLTQIFGMRGNMTDYQGRVIETPIFSSLKEGLTPFEFFISVYGAMKGMMDLSLKTAEAGYLTRRLVETVQNLIILHKDCQTKEGIWVQAIKEKDPSSDNSENITLNWEARAHGRYLAQDVITNKEEKILAADTLLWNQEIEILKNHQVSQIKVRSPFSCALTEGICQKCYGNDLSKNQELIEVGSAVGIIAAQSLGEPGTQLTMRTFHQTGEAGEDITQGLPKVKEVMDNVIPSPRKQAVLAQEEGEIKEIIDNDNEQITIKQKTANGQEIVYSFEKEKKLKVKRGQTVQKGESLTTGKVNLENLLSIVGRDACQNYIKEEIWKVYHSQGIKVNEKHIELFVRQMLRQVEITKQGESNYLVGEIISYQEFSLANKNLVEQKKEPAQAKYRIFGLKQIVRYLPSFLASASFQETLKSLLQYSLYRPIDYLQGPKESMIAGQITPVGKGLLERRKRESQKIRGEKLH